MRNLSVGLLVLGLGAMIGGPGIAQDARNGAALYGTYCAACHGPAAAGDGPVADLLTIPPPDLTGLAARNDGTFPVAIVVHRIDGTAKITAHGSPMPPFGGMFAGQDATIKTADGKTVRTSQAIADLIAYLRKVQG